jgi:hypothetical protein
MPSTSKTGHSTENSGIVPPKKRLYEKDAQMVQPTKKN